MAARTGRAVVARRGGAAGRSPDWDSLPDPLLRTVLLKASVDRPFPCPAAIVCKHWFDLVKEVQPFFRPLKKIPRGETPARRRAALIGGLGQFPNLTTLVLPGSNATAVLGEVAARCPQLAHLWIPISFYRGEPATSFFPSASLASVCETLTGLRSLVLARRQCVLSESISCLLRLESLKAKGVLGPLPEGLGQLSSLRELGLVGGGGGVPLPGVPAPVTTIPPSLGELRGLQKLKLVLPSVQDTDLPALEGLTALQSLTLHLPYLTDLQALVHISSLKNLELHCRSLQALPEFEHRLLQKLSLFLCHSLGALTAAFSSSISLQILSIFGCGSMAVLSQRL